MSRSRTALLILFSFCVGGGHAWSSERYEGIVVSWLAESNAFHPCVVVIGDADTRRLLDIGNRYSCRGRHKVIAHSASAAGLARILAALPTTPAPVDSDSSTYPWLVVRLKQDGDEEFRLSDVESQLLFKSIADDAPELRDEIDARLIHESPTTAQPAIDEGSQQPRCCTVEPSRSR
jgi:hypothetical protein